MQNNPEKKAKPLVVELAPGKHAICCCGQTSNAPFCDGSHRGSEYRPEIVQVDTLPANFAWCTCRASGKVPRCDGSHRQFWDNPAKPPPKAE
ncbi:MAG: CDGSH iron-sulfur domain-containing protein [Planctomycetota bacterium]|nr:CDGSH iron-sulfur domain-containing protein [Planctomycetota bacterium]